jgi:outer membrane protein TolC
LNAQLLRQTNDKLLEAKRERLRVLEELLAEGYVQKEELLRQQSELAFAEAATRQSRIRERVAGERLKNALYLEQPGELVLQAPKSYRKLAATPEDSPPEMPAQRSDYLALEQQVMAVDAEVQKARARLYPQLSLFGQYTRQDDTNLERDEVWAAGARLEWTIFEWGKNLAEIRRAQAERLRLRHQRDAYAQEIKTETSDLWGAVREKERLIEAWELKTQLNETLLERTMAEFREGKNTLSEILAQEAELVSGYNDYRREINELGIALAYLQAALDVPLDEWLVEQEIRQLDWTKVATGLQRLTESAPPPPPPAPPSPIQQAPAPAVAATDDAFVIQMGAFADRRNAEQLQEQTRAALPGQPVEISTVSGAYKVRMTGFSNKAAAQALLPTIRQKLGINGFLIRTTP